MKRHFLFSASAAALLVASSFAGETLAPPSKGVTPPEPIVFGRGWYFGLQAGVNVYQDFGGTRRFELGGNDIALEPKEKVGFAGGLKLGYVFGLGEIRPAIEADVFYNGVQADLDLRVNGNNTDFNADADLNSVAYIANFLVKFGTGPFQPYVGVGVGGYYTEVDNVNVRIAGRNFSAEGGEGSGFAWQIIGGADYYFNERTSVFGEYKFLNYEDAGITEDRVSQHLLMLGVRWHF